MVPEDDYGQFRLAQDRAEFFDDLFFAVPGAGFLAALMPMKPPLRVQKDEESGISEPHSFWPRTAALRPQQSRLLPVDRPGGEVVFLGREPGAAIFAAVIPVVIARHKYGKGTTPSDYLDLGIEVAPIGGVVWRLCSQPTRIDIVAKKSNDCWRFLW